MAKIISSIVHGIKIVKKNVGYLKAGIKESKKEYNELQRIKNKPPIYRTKSEVEYARNKNKTKGRSPKY